MSQPQPPPQRTALSHILNQRANPPAPPALGIDFTQARLKAAFDHFNSSLATVSSSLSSVHSWETSLDQRFHRLALVCDGIKLDADASFAGLPAGLERVASGVGAVERELRQMGLKVGEQTVSLGRGIAGLDAKLAAVAKHLEGSPSDDLIKKVASKSQATALAASIKTVIENVGSLRQLVEEDTKGSAQMIKTLSESCAGLSSQALSASTSLSDCSSSLDVLKTNSIDGLHALSSLAHELDALRCSTTDELTSLNSKLITEVVALSNDNAELKKDSALIKAQLDDLSLLVQPLVSLVPLLANALREQKLQQPAISRHDKHKPRMAIAPQLSFLPPITSPTRTQTRSSTPKSFSQPQSSHYAPASVGSPTRTLAPPSSSSLPTRTSSGSETFSSTFDKAPAGYSVPRRLPSSLPRRKIASVATGRNKKRTIEQSDSEWEGANSPQDVAAIWLARTSMDEDDDPATDDD